jgi:dihydroorotate dehydrogenase electron transfer subunit
MAIYRLRRRRTRTFLEIIYRIVGRGTDLLSRVEAGRNLWMLGPLGGTFRLPGPGIRPLLVGGGTGIASLHFLAERLVVSPRSRQKTAREALSVLIGARTRKQLLCRPDFRSLGARITLATDDGSVGARGTVTDLLEKTLANGARSGRPIGLVYACGPTVMMETVAALCARTGVDCQVSLEGPMACGFGVCLGCAVPCKVDSPDAPVRSPRDRFKLICADGPVFDAATLAWGWES